MSSCDRMPAPAPPLVPGRREEETAATLRPCECARDGQLERLTLLAEAIQRLSACEDRASILDVLGASARSLVDADGVSIVLREGDECFYARTDSPGGALWEGQRFPVVSCISGWVMLNRQTAIVPDIDADERIPHALYRATFVRSLVMVPVGRHDALATIGAYWAVARRPGQEEVALLQSLARAAGTALQRCEADEEARAGQRRLHLAFTNTLVGFGFATLDGHIVEVNERFSAICGYGAAELVGMHVRELTHPDDWDDNARLIRDLVAGKIPSFHLEKRYVHKDGRLVHVRNDVSLIDGGDGPAQIVAAVIDISEEKQAQAKLVQAQKLDLLGQLTGGIAHDFNNLLTIIEGSLESLSEQLEGNPGQYELARVAQQAAARGAELTRSLLAFARRQPVDVRPVAPDRVVSSMRSMLQRVLGSDIVLDVRLGSGDATVTIDVAQFESALVNLCVNARDALPAGGSLTIRTSRAGVGAEREHVMIAVADDGVGMSPETRARAFEPFFTTKHRGGSGLGLSMVYGFVTQAGGHVEIASAPGQGCTVTMALPCSGSPAPDPGVTAPPSRHGGGARVLLVEDDAAVRGYVRRTLLGLGYDVCDTGDPAAALALLDDGTRWDLMLTDIVMPGTIDGLKLADMARQRRPGLAVLYMSGCTDRFSAQGGRTIPAGRLLNKPFRRGELGDAVAACIAAGGQAGPCRGSG